MEMEMNRFLAVLALASLVATPALAQSYDPDLGMGNIAPAPQRRRADYRRLASDGSGAAPLCSGSYVVGAAVRRRS